MKTFSEIRGIAMQFESHNPKASICDSYMRGYIDAIKSQEPTMLTDEPPMIFGNSVAEPIPDFLDFWNAYDYKVARMQTQKMWEKLTIKQKREIMTRVPDYIASTTKTNERGKKARMHPSTFINPHNERWNDEVNIYQPHGTEQTISFAEQSVNGLANLIADRNKAL